MVDRVKDKQTQGQVMGYIFIYNFLVRMEDMFFFYIKEGKEVDGCY